MTTGEIARDAAATARKLTALISRYLDDGVDPNELTAAIDAVGELEVIERSYTKNGGEEHDA